MIDDPDAPVDALPTPEPGAVADTVDPDTVDPDTVDLEPVEQNADERAWRAEAARHDGRRRRRQGAIVIGVALASALVGVLIGSRIKSPADQAADRAAPRASRITVPVERQVLSSSIVLSGNIEYNEPTAIALAGNVGVDDGEAQVITKVPEQGQQVQEGDALFEVTGRPVFFLQGELPMYRALSVGSTGPDVVQLETSLDRLGFSPGTVDNVFDADTGTALGEFYVQAGYEVEGPSRTQRDELRASRQAVTDAEEALRSARADLERQDNTLPESTLLQLRQAVTSAEAAIPAAEAAATRNNDAAKQEVATATVVRDSARTIRDSAKTVRDAAAAPGAIDPVTGVAYTPEQIALLNADLARAEEAFASAEGGLAAAVAAQQAAATQGQSDIKAAKDNLDLARLQLAEATAPADTTDAQNAVNQAQGALDSARAELAQLETEVGVRVSPGEIVFVPILPSIMTELYALPGSAANEQMGTLSTSDTLVASRVSRGDSALVTVGAAVSITVRDFGFETTGTVVSVGQPRPEQGADDGGQNFGNDSSSSGRQEVLIAPDDPTALGQMVGAGVRISVDVESTEDEVLVVPVAALSVGPGGVSRVEVETSPVTADDPGATELVEVEVGLSAQGLVEVTGGDLQEGDAIVVGLESGRTADGQDDETGGTGEGDGG